MIEHFAPWSGQAATSPPHASRTGLLPAKRKILIYTHALAGGGAERALALLASGLVRRGHTVTFATDYRETANNAFLDERVSLLELGAGHAGATASLAKLLRRERFDASVSALGASNLKHAIAAALAGRRHQAIISYHGFFDAEPRTLSRLSFILTPLLSRLVGRTVAVSRALLDNLVHVWRADRARTRYAPNPVAWGSDVATPSRGGLRARDRIILACGRFNPGKNFTGLVRAFAGLNDPAARLVILGEGEERGVIVAEARRLGVADRVELPGYVAAPWAWYAKAACFAVSSKSESFGMVIVEALAHGLPVVATDCGGPREILADGQFGAIVPVDDDAAMTQALAAAFADPGDPAPRLARAADYSVDAAVNAWEALFDELGGAPIALQRLAAPDVAR